jgi:methyl-accepting chemotaxis protein
MRFKLSFKIMLHSFLGITVTAAALIYFSYLTARHDLEKSLGDRLEAIAATGALMLDGDLHDTIREPKDHQTEAFKQLRTQLLRIKKANRLDTEVYTFRREGDLLKFIVMTNSKSYIGHTYQIKREMWPALNEGKTSHTSIYEDNHGIWLTAYAPIFDSRRQVAGILDVDFKLTKFQQELEAKVLRLALVSGGVLALMLLVSFFLSHRLVRQIRYLRDVAEKISLGQMDRAIQVNTSDEVGELAQSMERMRQSVKLAIAMIDEKGGQN